METLTAEAVVDRLNAYDAQSWAEDRATSDIWADVIDTLPLDADATARVAGRSDAFVLADHTTIRWTLLRGWHIAAG